MAGITTSRNSMKLFAQQEISWNKIQLIQMSLPTIKQKPSSLKKLQVQRNSWQEKTQSLNLEKDTNKLWQLTKILNRDVQERNLTVLEHNGELVTGKRAAKTLAKMYKKDSGTNPPRERIREARAELKNPQKHSGKQECMTSALRVDELEEAIKQLKNKKSPGPDNVNNDMIKHFG